MFALYEDTGRFFAGRVLAASDASLQVELETGKRVKVKAASVMLRFEQPQAAELMVAAQALAAGVDLDIAWEFAPAEDFGFADLAREYFSRNATIEQQAAMLFAVFGAPHYFRRLGRGNFRKAPAETVKAALLGIERKKQQAAQVDAWAAELVAGVCPAPVREQLYKILFKPDKNAPETMAVVEAARRSQRAALDLLTAAGAIDSPYQFHWRRFLFENFPKGSALPQVQAPPITQDLPLAGVSAFSIDDSATTEIDDALSVQGLGTGSVTLGIHIAAPGLAFAPESALDTIARERLSTVYMPGWKLTMLPEAVIDAYTLTAGQACPAVSLYTRFDETTLEVQASETRLERVMIADNLRHDRLDDVITQASLTGEAPADYAHGAELAFAFRLARHLKAQREAVRGKPELFNRPDYSFHLLRDDADTCEPRGDETVRIGTRKRGAPLDLIVSEAMILANSHWGGWLADCGVPGIYRSQASMAPGVKVRLGTKPAPHAGLGVAQYTWATSPLRRYVDLVNQWQIIACARFGRTAALAAPFKPRDAQLFSIISGFDAAYAAYNGFQSAIERYWTLRSLAQDGVRELDASVMANGLVRAETPPLVFRAAGAEGIPRGARVRVRLGEANLLTLDLHASVVARLDADDAATAQAVAETGTDDADAEESEGAGPLTLAIELKDDDETDAAPAAAT